MACLYACPIPATAFLLLLPPALLLPVGIRADEQEGKSGVLWGKLGKTNYTSDIARGGKEDDHGDFSLIRL